MSMTVREPRPGDGPGMARVWLSAGRYYAELDPAHFKVPDADGLADAFEDSIATAPDADALRLVADSGGAVAGWLAARIERPIPTQAQQLVRETGWTRLYVDTLVVDRARWRQGTGTALLAEAESWGRARGAEVVRLDTYADGPVSVPFYERHLGYQRRAIVFQKRL